MKIRSKRDRHSAPRIEIIPLIDIMFFLLATFVMVSTSMIRNQGIGVKLPAANTGKAIEREDSVSVSVRESGEILFDRAPVSLDELRGRLFEVRSKRPDTRVFIQGDGRASVQSLVKALDEVRRSGLTQVALETASSG